MAYPTYSGSSNSNPNSNVQVYINGQPFVGTLTVGSSASSFQMTATSFCDSHESGGFWLDAGEIVTGCIHCGARILVRHLPGGLLAMRIEEMLERLAAGDLAGELIAEYAEVQRWLHDDLEALSLASKQLQTIQSLLKQKGLL